MNDNSTYGVNSSHLQELESGIRNSVTSPEGITTELATSQRIIARVTDGIYREPWAAFRELIVNAYDADASYVLIETGVPEFEQVTVRDDGLGMSPKTLAYVLKNIGGSSKRVSIGTELNTVKSGETDRSPGGRLLIGKIGIGLFAIAQLTQHFQIITKSRGENIRISATFQLKTNDDSNFESPEREYVAGDVTIKSEAVQDDEIDSHGTTIVLYSLRPAVRSALQSLQRWEAYFLEKNTTESLRAAPTYHIGCEIEGEDPQTPEYPWISTDNPEERFKKFIDKVGQPPNKGAMSANLEHFDEYHKLIWNLSLSLPLDYLHEHPLDFTGTSGLIFYEIPSKGQAQVIDLPENESIREYLSQNDVDGHSKINSSNSQAPFSVTIDRVRIKRPIRLPQELEKESRIQAPVMLVARVKNPFDHDQLQRAGGSLSFDAYLYWNSKIVPKETAGVLIRIREASGTLFDRTFLNYQVSEQTRLRQITAEIFIHEGLDSAINIDRESFNYSHPHFLYIQKWLHKALRLMVNRLKGLASEHLNQEKETRRLEAKAALQEKAENIWFRRYGEEADPPLPKIKTRISTLEEVGGVEIKWIPEEEPKEKGKASALAVVLEAYGVLSRLSGEDRSKLIRDILDIFEN